MLVMALGLSVAMTSCGDDDSAPEVQSAKDVEGNYAGKMLATPIQPEQQNAAESPVGVDVTAKVEATDVVFAKFPIAELIKLIVGEDLAPGIIEAVGDVTYKLPYTAKLSKDYATIDLTFAPVPLELEIALPPVVAPTEGEEAPKTKVTVTISAEDAGVFTYEGKTLKFNMNIEKVMLGETEFPMPAQLKLNFGLAR